MFKYLFKYLNLRRENERLSMELDDQRKQISELLMENAALKSENELLWKQISRRDQKITEQQKRMRFFGIRIGNEEDEVEKLDFPSTIKI